MQPGPTMSEVGMLANFPNNERFVSLNNKPAQEFSPPTFRTFDAMNE